MLENLLKSIFGSKHEREVRRALRTEEFVDSPAAA